MNAQGEVFLKRGADWVPINASSIPQVYKYTATYSQLATAGLTNDIELFSLPAGGIIKSVKLKHSTPFTGGTIATYTLSVGITGNLVKYMAAFNVFQATGDSVLNFSTLAAAENHNSATSVRVAAISTVGNLNAATQGSADIFVEWFVAR